jgi:FkbM family methyltransferase
MTARLRRAVARRADRARFALARALASRRVAQIRELSFTVQCDNPMTYFRWETCATEEPATLDWIDTALGERDVFFDVGSNIGLYAMYAARRHPTLRVIAFEPEYANLHYLRDNVALNGFVGRIEAYAVALAERSDLGLLHIQDLTPGAALHTAAFESISRTDAGRAVVATEGIWAITMDEFCERRGVWPNAIKIDVDGAEARVLAGARRTLTAPDLRTILVEVGEVGNSRAACERLLAGAGFTRTSREASGYAENEIWVRPRQARELVTT